MASWGDSNYMIASRLDRPASTKSALEKKKEERELLAVQMLEWEAKNKVTVIPYGVSKERQLFQMRDGDLELISMSDLAERWELHPRVIHVVLQKWPTLMYIMKGDKRHYWIEDIKRLEQIPNYKAHKSL